VIAIIVLVAVLVGSGLMLAASQSSSRALIKSRYGTKVASGAALVATYVDQIAVHERVVEAQDLAGPNPSDADMALASQALGSPAAVFLNGQGDLIRAYPADPALIGTQLTNRYVHLREARDGHVGVSNVVRSAVKGIPIVAVAIPALSPSDTVLSAGFNIQHGPLTAYLASAFPNPTSGVYVTDAAGSLVASSRSESPSVALRRIDPVLASAVKRAPSGDFRISTSNAEQFYATARVAGTPWMLVATIPVASLNQPLRGSWFPWVLLSVFALVGIFALLLVGRVLADRNAVLVARKDLEVARDVALSATREKSAFLAMMSHEIRTPMNAVIGMTGLLLSTPLNDDQQEFVETVRNSGDSLLSIINDVLDFSKIEAGGLELESQPFNLRECVEDALDVAASANDKGIELLGEIDCRCPTSVVGDATRLRQVLVNLLGNAVKFTEQGEVVLTVAPGTGHDRVGLHFSVKDSGIGIPPDRLGSLFDSFSQVDRSTTRLYGGTGLGLTISRQLVEAMGGSLAVESVRGEGSNFSFWADLGPSLASVELAPRGSASVLEGRSALVVDDSATGRRVMRLQLEGWGMTVTEAANGEAAANVARSTTTFDVVLVDMSMPGRNGEETAQELRAIRSTSGIPILLMSSRTDRSRVERPELFFAVLTKPLRSARLKQSSLDAVSSASPIDRRRTSRTEVSEAPTAMRVLLVEDNPVNQRVGRLMLEKLGHFIDVVGNGLEAVDAVAMVPYDAVFMDIQMPEMDGLTAAATIRSNQPLQMQPYIVGLTASVLIEDHQACVKAGMNDFLTKPARINDLQTALVKAQVSNESASNWSGHPTEDA
jgi:signal transduction histidine kinase/DNA-binding response OmpR family regulator